jgi:hypothetical protein
LLAHAAQSMPLMRYLVVVEAILQNLADRRFVH